MAVAYRVPLSVAAREHLTTAHRLLFRYLLTCSVGPIAFLCVLAHIRSTPVRGWMLP